MSEMFNRFLTDRVDMRCQGLSFRHRISKKHDQNMGLLWSF